MSDAGTVHRLIQGLLRQRRRAYRRELDYVPEPEMPARLSRQLLSLVRGSALVCGHEQVDDTDISRVIRVGMDCLPAVRLGVLGRLAQGKVPIPFSDVDDGLPDYSATLVRRTLEDLQALGLVQSHGAGAGFPGSWKIHPNWQDLLCRLCGKTHGTVGAYHSFVK